MTNYSKKQKTIYPLQFPMIGHQFYDEKSGLKLDTNRVENYLPSKKPQTKKEMLAYIEDFDTWFDGWYGPRTYALNIRVGWNNAIKLPLHLPEGDWFEEELECWWQSNFPDLLKDFEDEHPGYTLITEGRSGGQLALYRKNGRYVPSPVLFTDSKVLLKKDVEVRFDLLWDFACCVAMMARDFVYHIYDFAVTNYEALVEKEEEEA